MAAAAWVVEGLSSDHTRSRSRQIDWIYHLRIQIKLSISSSHLHLQSLSHRLIVLQRMWCKNYAQARISAVCQPLMSLLSVHALPVVNTLTRSLKLTARSRAVQIFHCRCIAICLLDSNRCSLFGFFSNNRSRWFESGIWIFQIFESNIASLPVIHVSSNCWFCTLEADGVKASTSVARYYDTIPVSLGWRYFLVPR